MLFHLEVKSTLKSQKIRLAKIQRFLAKIRCILAHSGCIWNAFGSNLSRCISTECVRLTISNPAGLSNTAAFTAVFCLVSWHPNFLLNTKRSVTACLSERIESYKALKLHIKKPLYYYSCYTLYLAVTENTACNFTQRIKSKSNRTWPKFIQNFNVLITDIINNNDAMNHLQEQIY